MTSRPLRVAFIRYRYDPYGGAERFTQSLAAMLAERGAEIHVFARKWSDFADGRACLHRIGGPSWPALLGYASFVFLVGRAVRKERLDLVQSNERTLCQHIYRAGDGVHARWLELRGLQQGRLRRLTVLLNPFHLYRLQLERRLFEHPDLKAVIVNSEMVRRDILTRFGIADERIHTIYNGVDLQRFHPVHRATLGVELRSRCGLDREKPVVLFVGSGFERKGLTPLLRGMAEAGGDARLWVVGKGKTNRYRKLAKRLGISDRVIFWGPQEDTAPFYAAADIFALPTLYDPFPSVVLEAMASGLPVVTTAQCGAAEIITQGREGFVLATPNEISQMAGSLAQLYRADQRRGMALEARKLAEAFPFERTVREMENLYRTLLVKG